jgi:hypothetical protein
MGKWEAAPGLQPESLAIHPVPEQKSQTKIR